MYRGTKGELKVGWKPKGYMAHGMCSHTAVPVTKAPITTLAPTPRSCEELGVGEARRGTPYSEDAAITNGPACAALCAKDTDNCVYYRVHKSKGCALLNSAAGSLVSSTAFLAHGTCTGKGAPLVTLATQSPATTAATAPETTTAAGGFPEECEDQGAGMSRKGNAYKQNSAVTDGPGCAALCAADNGNCVYYIAHRVRGCSLFKSATGALQTCKSCVAHGTCIDDSGSTEVAEDIAGNTNGVSATAAQINEIDGVSGARADVDYTQGLKSGTFANPATPTGAEIQTVVESANAQHDAMAAIVEDVAGNADGTPATADQLNLIPGVSGATAKVDYSKALAAGSFAKPGEPTAEEIQAVVDTVKQQIDTAMLAIADVIGGDGDATPATATQLNTVPGVSGARPGVDYTKGLQTGTFADSANPTGAEIQSAVDAANTQVDDALSAIVEDAAGNADGVSATVTQLNSIPGVAGARPGVDYASALLAGTFADPAAPTAAEIQAAVDARNVQVAAALSAVAEDASGNADAVGATPEQINSIPGVSGALAGASYTKGLQDGTFADSSAPTAAEVQAVVDAVNAQVADALAAVAKAIADTGVAPSHTDLNSIPGVSGALDGVAYSQGFTAGTFADPAAPTAAEIQTVIDTANGAVAAASSAVAEDIAGNADGVSATPAQLNSIPGVSGALDGVDYASELKAGSFADPAAPTAAEIQAAVDARNVQVAAALSAVAEIASGNTDAVGATPEQINSIPGVSGALAGASYTKGLQDGTFADSSSPTAAEVQAVVDAVNAQVADALAAISKAIAETGVAPSHTVLNSIPGVSGALDGVAYSQGFADGTFADPAAPTTAEIQAVVDAVNAAVAAASSAVAEDIAGNKDGVSATPAQLNSVPGVSGAQSGVDYSSALLGGQCTGGGPLLVAETSECGYKGADSRLDDENLDDVQSASDCAVLAADGGYQTFYLGVRYATGRCHAGPTLYAKEVVRANLNTPQKLQDMWPDVCAVGSTPDDMFNLYLALPCTIVAAGKFADPSAPTAAEIQAAVDARNVQVAAALSAVVEDASGNDDAVGATPEQINSIPGVSGALDGVAYSQGFTAGTFADPAAPTAAEIQAVIDTVNGAVAAASSAVAEDIAGNADGVSATPAQLNSIPGVSGALDGVDYASELKAGSFADPAAPTAAEILAVVDASNTQSTLAEVVKAIAGTASAPSHTTLNSISGVSGALESVDYNKGFMDGTYADSSAPTPAEVQTVIDAVNTQVTLAAVAKAIADGSSAPPHTVLNSIDGVSGALDGIDYTKGLQGGSFADSSAPTAAEVQAVVDAVNAQVAAQRDAMAAIVEDVAGNADGTPATADQLNLIPGVSGATGPGRLQQSPCRRLVCQAR